MTQFIPGVRVVLVAVAALCVPALMSCSGKKAPASSEVLGPPIATASDTTSAVATIESVDSIKHAITLKNPNGTTNTINCGRKVVNFDQFRVGDRVDAIVTNEIAIYPARPGQEPNPEIVSSVQRPPKGSKPGLVVTDSAEVSARVNVIDPDNRTILLSSADGKTQTLALQAGADIAAVHSGDTVIMRCTQVVSILVTGKP